MPRWSVTPDRDGLPIVVGIGGSAPARRA
jgi:hypothetical protein